MKETLVGLLVLAVVVGPFALAAKKFEWGLEDTMRAVFWALVVVIAIAAIGTLGWAIGSLVLGLLP